jgi:hypothetical protein
MNEPTRRTTFVLQMKREKRKKNDKRRQIEEEA